MISHYQLRAMTASDISAIDNQFLKQHWGSRHESLTAYFKQQQTDQRWVFIAETAGKSQVMSLCSPPPYMVLL